LFVLKLSITIQEFWTRIKGNHLGLEGLRPPTPKSFPSDTLTFRTSLLELGASSPPPKVHVSHLKLISLLLSFDMLQEAIWES
jgi:hypothetical protein